MKAAGHGEDCVTGVLSHSTVYFVGRAEHAVAIGDVGGSTAPGVGSAAVAAATASSKYTGTEG